MLGKWVTNKSMKFNHALSITLKIFLGILIINSIIMNLWHLMSISILLLVLLFIPQFLKKRHQIIIPNEFEFLLLIFVIAILILNKFGTIITPLSFGIAMGFLGFLIILILYSDSKIKKDYFFIITFAICLSVATGFFIELMKYYLKLFLGYSLTDGNYIFTMRIMSYVVLGALISSVIGYLYMAKKLSFFDLIIHRFERINPTILFKRKITPNELSGLIKKGENENIEFKSTLRYNIYTKEIDKKIENSALKTLTAFLNSGGGTLLVGISDKGNVTGLEKDHFQNSDKIYLHVNNLIKGRIGKEVLHLINYEIIKIKKKEVLKIDCVKSSKPVFLKAEGGVEEFYIRSGPASIKLEGSELIEYINRRFG